jgi:hypothetical protein
MFGTSCTTTYSIFCGASVKAVPTILTIALVAGLTVFAVGIIRAQQNEIAALKAAEQPDVRALIRSTVSVNEGTIALLAAMERACK